MSRDWGGLDPPMLDVLASKARTAIDDPLAVPEVGDPPWPGSPEGYALDRLDDLIGLLNPSMETIETFRRSIVVLGRHLADRVDRMENLALDDGEEPWGEAINAVSGALDLLDEAITALTPEDER